MAGRVELEESVAQVQAGMREELEAAQALLAAASARAEDELDRGLAAARRIEERAHEELAWERSAKEDALAAVSELEAKLLELGVKVLPPPTEHEAPGAEPTAPVESSVMHALEATGPRPQTSG